MSRREARPRARQVCCSADGSVSLTLAGFILIRPLARQTSRPKGLRPAPPRGCGGGQQSRFRAFAASWHVVPRAIPCPCTAGPCALRPAAATDKRTGRPLGSDLFSFLLDTPGQVSTEMKNPTRGIRCSVSSYNFFPARLFGMHGYHAAAWP